MLRSGAKLPRSSSAAMESAGSCATSPPSTMTPSWGPSAFDSCPRTRGDAMKLLLTSGGVTNPSIHAALVRLLGKSIEQCHALCVPTAQWGHPMCGPTSVQGLVAAKPNWQHFTGLGWASLGVLEL